MIGIKGLFVATLLILAGLALWWRYGLVIVLNELSWFCLSG